MIFDIGDFLVNALTQLLIKDRGELFSHSIALTRFLSSCLPSFVDGICFALCSNVLTTDLFWHKA